jgi:hypothetical protein
MMRKMRCRSSEPQPEQRGNRPFGAMRPFGPGSNSVEPQMGQAPAAFWLSALALALITPSS